MSVHMLAWAPLISPTCFRATNTSQGRYYCGRHGLRPIVDSTDLILLANAMDLALLATLGDVSTVLFRMLQHRPSTCVRSSRTLTVCPATSAAFCGSPFDVTVDYRWLPESMYAVSTLSS